jgi:acetyl-CoA hydrolase
VTGSLLGSKRVYDFAHRNSAVMFRSTFYTHDPDVLARIDRLVAINSAIEVDLTGQINAEIAGGTYIGSIGGAGDFLRGAHRSKGGLPLIVLPAMAGKRGRIVATLSGPVSTPRSDAGVFITEHGIADLRGCTLSERVRRMLAIAAPEHREDLAREAHTLRLTID